MSGCTAYAGTNLVLRADGVNLSELACKRTNPEIAPDRHPALYVPGLVETGRAGALCGSRIDGPHFAQHRRDQLGNRRVDWHGTLQDGARDVGIHHVEDAVNGFVATGAKDGPAEDALRLRVDDYLHEPLRFVLLDGPCDAAHWSLADKERPAACPS